MNATSDQQGPSIKSNTQPVSDGPFLNFPISSTNPAALMCIDSVAELRLLFGWD